VTNSPQLGSGAKAAIALCLTGIGGFVDAVGYIALFQIFTANMSGNSIHVGMYLGQGDLAGLERPACAVGAFFAGMVLTRIAIEIATRTRIKRIASFTLSAEAILLLLFAQATPGMHLGQIANLHSPLYFALVAMLAFAMGVQTVTLTHVGPLTVYTTFVTGTLTKFAESFTEAIFWIYDRVRQSLALSEVARLATKQEDVRHAALLAAAWICYLGGAALGTFVKYRWELRAMYLPAAVLALFVLVDRFRPIAVGEDPHQRT
jgi:uncharacterized membrane protein YoaK (UPF0700 family)